MAKVAWQNKKGTATTKQHAQNDVPLQDTEDCELSEGGLPTWSTLAGSKSLLDDYPEDEANSKKAKKTNTGKGKKGHPKPK
jgi:hypothetical protein